MDSIRANHWRFIEKTDITAMALRFPPLLALCPEGSPPTSWAWLSEVMVNSLPVGSTSWKALASPSRDRGIAEMSFEVLPTLQFLQLRRI